MGLAGLALLTALAVVVVVGGIACVLSAVSSARGAGLVSIASGVPTAFDAWLAARGLGGHGSEQDLELKTKEKNGKRGRGYERRGDRGSVGVSALRGSINSVRK